MILFTAGTQLPFDRFLEAIDALAPELEEDFVVQAMEGKYKPRNFKPVGIMPVEEFEELVRRCSLVVGHAGTGTALTALALGKPLALFPRLASMGEHRSEHQRATAEKLRAMHGVPLACGALELKRLVLHDWMGRAGGFGGGGERRLTAFLSNFINE